VPRQVRDASPLVNHGAGRFAGRTCCHGKSTVASVALRRLLANERVSELHSISTADEVEMSGRQVSRNAPGVRSFKQEDI
jgi:hypothetical protein